MFHVPPSPFFTFTTFRFTFFRARGGEKMGFFFFCGSPPTTPPKLEGFCCFFKNPRKEKKSILKAPRDPKIGRRRLCFCFFWFFWVPPFPLPPARKGFGKIIAEIHAPEPPAPRRFSPKKKALNGEKKGWVPPPPPPSIGWGKAKKKKIFPRWPPPASKPGHLFGAARGETLFWKNLEAKTLPSPPFRPPPAPPGTRPLLVGLDAFKGEGFPQREPHENQSFSPKKSGTPVG